MFRALALALLLTSCKKIDCTAACKNSGKCLAKGGICVATDEGCQATDACKSDGKCTAADGGCALVSAADCARTSYCKSHGQCGMKNGECAVTSTSDCIASTRCKEEGRCTAMEHVVVTGAPRFNPGPMRCMVAGREDCAKCDACKNGGCDLDANLGSNELVCVKKK